MTCTRSSYAFNFTFFVTVLKFSNTIISPHHQNTILQKYLELSDNHIDGTRIEN